MRRASPSCLFPELLAGALSLGACLVACKPEPRQEPAPPQVIQIAPGISATVVATVDPDEPGAAFLCSTCYQTFPLRTVHVVPTYNASLARYVGSNRCDKDWRPSVAETRARLSSRPSVDELATFFEVFVSRGHPAEELRVYTQGKPGPAAALAVLDALEKGEIKLTVDGRP
jgi:hypothetical protein